MTCECCGRSITACKKEALDTLADGCYCPCNCKCGLYWYEGAHEDDLRAAEFAALQTEHVKMAWMLGLWLF